MGKGRWFERRGREGGEGLKKMCGQQVIEDMFEKNAPKSTSASGALPQQHVLPEKLSIPEDVVPQVRAIQGRGGYVAA